MSNLRTAAQQALEACEQRLPLKGQAEIIDELNSLRAALAEPTPSQQLAAAGFTRRDTRLECDECGGKFTRQMLPIHKCEPVQDPVCAHGVGKTKCSFCSVENKQPVQEPVEPVAQVHPNHLKPTDDGKPWCREVLLYSGDHNGDLSKGENYRVKLYTAPPQRKPLTEEEIDGLMQSIGLRCADDGNERMSNHAEWERGQRRRIARAIERAHGIGGAA